MGGAPALVLNLIQRAAQPGGGAQWLENNIEGIARGTVQCYSAVGMSEMEVQAAALMYLPYPQIRDVWTDPAGNQYCLPSASWQIEGTYNVGCFFPAAGAAAVLANGWAQMQVMPSPTVMMSAIWKLAFIQAEGLLILPAFVIAAQMAVCITVLGAGKGERRWFSAVQEWTRVSLPRPDSSQFVRAAVA
eukprot:1265866-Amphidinium_carterae.1